VVTSTRGASTRASAAATSAGNSGCPSCTANGASSGSSTDISMPYMCCGGTVATTCAVVEPGRNSRNPRAFAAVLARNEAQVFACGFGWPVLPEVKPMATVCAASIRGTAVARPFAPSAGMRRTDAPNASLSPSA
jgi:hypothetical protein